MPNRLFHCFTFSAKPLVHMRDGEVIGVRHHLTTLTVVVYEASLESVLPMLNSKGWRRSDASATQTSSSAVIHDQL